MINGIGFSEVVLIALIVLIFFGSRELPQFIRKAVGLMGKIKQATDKVKSEINSIATPLEESTPLPDAGAEKKKELRKEYALRRKTLTEKERDQKSQEILSQLLSLSEFNTAKALCIYCNTPYEVATGELIKHCLLNNKRVILPYCKESEHHLGIAEIKNLATDTAVCAYGILEPIKDLRDNFLRSDLSLIVCPGVAFDRYGGRLGMGKGYYDSFLRELKQRCFCVGVAFNCQIVETSLPFSYHDIPMNQIITENGLLISKSTQEPG